MNEGVKMRSIVSLLLLLNLCGSASAQSAEQVIAEFGRKRASLKVIRLELQLKRTIHAQTKVSREQPFPVHEPIKPIQVEQKIIAIIDFETGCYRWEYDGQDYDGLKKEIVPYRGICAYDGTVHRSVVYPRTGLTDAGIGIRSSDFAELRGDLREQGFPPNEVPLYMSLGILPAAGVRPLHPGGFHKYNVRDHADTYYPTAKPPAGLSGVWLSTSSSPGYTDQYCFDPKSNFALARWQAINGQFLNRSASLTYKQEGDRYQLAGWEIEFFQLGVKMTSYQYIVKRLETNYIVHNSDFELKPSSGMTSSKIEYKPPEANTTVAPAVKRFHVTEDGREIPLSHHPNRPARTRFWIVLSALAVIIAVSLLIVRSRIRSKPRPELS